MVWEHCGKHCRLKATQHTVELATVLFFSKNHITQLNYIVERILPEIQGGLMP